jgi:DNA end-binding protein Ku
VLLRDSLDRSGKVALAQVALRQRESLATLRPRDGVLVLETLLWPDEIRVPDFKFLDDDIEVRSQELQMAASLIESMTVDFDPDEYHDHYREALQELVDAKVEGREIVQPEGPSEPAELTSLADALKASLAAAQGGTREAGEVKAAVSPRAIEDGAKKSRSAAKSSTAKSSGASSAGASRAKSSKAKAAETGSGAAADAEAKAETSKPAAAKGAQRPAAKRSAKSADTAATQSKTRRRAS